MIAYKDFVPQITKSGGFFTSTEFQDLIEPVVDANDWIEANNISVINVETVVLPNMHNEEGSEDVSIRTSGEMSAHWYQFIRVWYNR